MNLKKMLRNRVKREAEQALTQQKIKPVKYQPKLINETIVYEGLYLDDEREIPTSNRVSSFMDKRYPAHVNWTRVKSFHEFGKIIQEKEFTLYSFDHYLDREMSPRTGLLAFEQLLFKWDQNRPITNGQHDILIYTHSSDPIIAEEDARHIRTMIDSVLGMEGFNVI